MPLQRVMTDFGADHAFGQVPKKLQEHYGIDMPVSTIRKITEFHGEQIHQQRETMTLPLTTPGCRQQIGEIDGCMLPIVTICEQEGDKRKQKKLHEHYGIEMPVSTIRKVTEFHGEHMHQQRETMSLSLTTSGCRQQIGEIDGCMLPLVTIGEKEDDKRKQKSCIGKRPV